MKRLDQIPGDLSIYQLLADHIESHRLATGRRMSAQQAAMEIDRARCVSPALQPRRPCGCRECELARHLCETMIFPHEDMEWVHQWADAAEFGAGVHIEGEC